MQRFPEEYPAQAQGNPVAVNSVIQSFNPILSERKINNLVG